MNELERQININDSQGFENNNTDICIDNNINQQECSDYFPQIKIYRPFNPEQKQQKPDDIIISPPPGFENVSFNNINSQTINNNDNYQ